jgi:hypothetical protein
MRMDPTGVSAKRIKLMAAASIGALVAASVSVLWRVPR